MLKDPDRFCDGCGQKLPATSKLSSQVVSKEEAAAYRSGAQQNPDGTVMIDLCLQCRVNRANRLKHSL
jgi:hypothetical protein